MAAKGSKGKNIDMRQCIRRVGKDPVRAVLYDGHHIGHGKYFTGDVNGVIVRDSTGKPLPLRSIGRLVSHLQFAMLYPVEEKR